MFHLGPFFLLIEKTSFWKLVIKGNKQDITKVISLSENGRKAWKCTVHLNSGLNAVWSNEICVISVLQITRGKRDYFRDTFPYNFFTAHH